MQDSLLLQRKKREIRVEAAARRQAQPNIEHASRDILERCVALPEYTAAKAVMLYVSFGSEVCTRPLLDRALSEGKRIVIPYCRGATLGLFRLTSMDELSVSTYGILEPKIEMRANQNRAVDVMDLDVIVVPGVAFDRRGGRLGHGKGYYDNLLAEARSDALVVGAAFECQIFPQVPMLPHDVYMKMVVTEKTTYCSSGS